VPLEIVDDYRDSAFAAAQTGLLFNLPQPPAERAQLPAGLSLCMIVKNEERFLAECLASVRDCVDEINIVDTGSTDRTVEIARSFGANVIVREWRNDFAWARNEAVAMATRRWTLVLDADEELVPESVPLLRALGATPAGVDAVYIQIQNAVEDESGAATMTHYLTRIFPTTSRIRYKNVIHENLALDDGALELPAVMSPVKIVHKGYTKAVLEGKKKDERNTPLLAKAIREAPEDAFSWFNFGVSAVAGGDADGGIEALEKMFALGDRPRAFWPLAYVMLGTAHAELKGDVERGLEVVDRGLAENDDHPNLVFTRGYFLSLAKRFDEARTWYERAMGLRHAVYKHYMVDDEIVLWKAAFNLGSTYLKQERYAEALPWFEQALVNKPDSSLLRGVTARAYEKAGKVYDAERMYREGAERGGEAAFTAYANFLLRRRRFAQAFELVDRRAEPLSDAAYVTLLVSAATTTRSEKLGDPEPYALRALELAPGHGIVLGLLDELYAERGDAAKRAGLRAAELHAPLVDGADFARRSHRLLEEQRVGDALDAAERGLERQPRDPVLRYNAALAAARLGRDDLARTKLDDIAADSPVAPSAFALRVEIERRAGDLDAALAALDRIATLPRRDDLVLRNAAVDVAGALIQAGRLAEAGALAERVLA
jgi:glycosyltransferase involved in cell wall biosynthesis/thioredoxin-like negative regulator of GroEL